MIAFCQMALTYPDSHSTTHRMQMKFYPIDLKRATAGLSRAALVSSSALAIGMLAACQPATTQKEESAGAVGKPQPPSESIGEGAARYEAEKLEGKEAKALSFRPNPNPVEAYEVVLTLENAPGPFEAVSASAFYQAEGCSYFYSRYAGASGPPDYSVDLELTKQADGRFVTKVYADYFLPGNFFGNGECKWKEPMVGAVIKAPTGGEFLIVLSSGSFHDSTGSMQLFPHRWYQLGKRSTNLAASGLYPGSVPAREMKPDNEHLYMRGSISARRL